MRYADRTAAGAYHIDAREVSCTVQGLHSPLVVYAAQACVLKAEVEQTGLKHDCGFEVDGAGITLHTGIVKNNRYLKEAKSCCICGHNASEVLTGSADNADKKQEFLVVYMSLGCPLLGVVVTPMFTKMSYVRHFISIQICRSA